MARLYDINIKNTLHMKQMSSSFSKYFLPPHFNTAAGRPAIYQFVLFAWLGSRAWNLALWAQCTRPFKSFGALKPETRRTWLRWATCFDQCWPVGYHFISSCTVYIELDVVVLFALMPSQKPLILKSLDVQTYRGSTVVTFATSLTYSVISIWLLWCRNRNEVSNFPWFRDIATSFVIVKKVDCMSCFGMIMASRTSSELY